MEPEYTIKDDAIVSEEAAETEQYQEPAASTETVQQNTETADVPEESDISFVSVDSDENEESSQPQLDQQVADQAASSSNNVAGMFTTTAGAVGVVAAVAILSLGASDAEIIKVKSFENTVFYHVNVADNPNIEPGSLQLILESEADEYVVDLDFGETYGFVPRVAPDTEFTVSLVGQGLIGQTTLGSVLTQTSSSPNAVLYFPELLNSLDDDVLNYEMRSYLEDPLGLIASMILETGYYNPYTEETTWFESIAFDSGMTRYSIEGVPNRNSQVISRLTAILNLEESPEVVIDETRFYTPLYHEASARLVSVTNQTAQVELLPDFTYLIDAVYTLRLLDIDREVQVDQITSGDGPLLIDYDGLYTNTRYGVEVVVEFTPPGKTTATQLTLLQEEFVTPERINIVSASVVNDASVLITITAKGNIAQYTQLYYEIAGERYLVPLPKSSADTALITVSFDRGDADYDVTLGLTNDTSDSDYIIGPETIERIENS